MELIRRDRLGIRGRIILSAYPAGTLATLADRDGVEPVAQVVVDNAIVDSGRDWVAALMADAAGSTPGTYTVGITHCAIGEDDGAVADAQTTLLDEYNRRVIAAVDITDNVVIYSTFFTSGQSGIEVEEVGLFGHDATLAADSGIMFNRALLNYDNSAGNFDLTFDVEITFG